MPKQSNPYAKIPIDTLLDELIAAYTNYIDYLNRADYIVWTKGAEDIAEHRYLSIRSEIESRCSH